MNFKWLWGILEFITMAGYLHRLLWEQDLVQAQQMLYLLVLINVIMLMSIFAAWLDRRVEK